VGQVADVSWPLARKLEAAFQAPLGRGFARADSRWIERPGFFQIITPSAPYLNEVAFSDVPEDDVEQVIDEVIATYAALGKDVKWYVSPQTRPLDFTERLAARGFTSWQARAMGVETTLAFPVGAGIEVAPVGRDQIETFVTVSAKGWEGLADQHEHEVAALHRALEAEPRVVRFFVATLDGEPVGTAGLLLRDGYGYLLGTQVLSAARGRGVYKALVATRLALLRERGFGYAVTHAREATSAPILERLGFETLYRTSAWVLPAEAAAELVACRGTARRSR
jgi:GNAT superfamily N-acetyltransferase